MNKLLWTIGIFCLWVSGSIFASDSFDNSIIQLYSAQPCQFWRSEIGGGYTCSSYHWRMQIADGTDVRRAIYALENKVQELEARIKKLEGTDDSK